MPKIINTLKLAVTRMLAFEVNSSRIAKVKMLNVTTLRLGDSFDEVNISDPSISVTGANNIVSYKPNYHDTTNFGHGGSNTTAIFFFNMKEIFPCIKSLTYHYHPVCKIFTNEEDGFRSFRSIIEAADSGNHFRIFNTPSEFSLPTYGFGIQGCAEFTRDCLPTYHLFVIVCYLSC